MATKPKVLVPIPCAYKGCAQEFLPSHPHNRYCSPECRNEVKKRRARINPEEEVASRKPPLYNQPKRKSDPKEKFTPEGFVAKLYEIRRELNEQERDPDDAAWGTEPNYGEFIGKNKNERIKQALRARAARNAGNP